MHKKKIELILFGGGHIAQKFAEFCNIQSIPYKIYDDRPEFASQKVFPSAKMHICASFDRISANIKLSSRSYCVIMTYGHVHDETCLAQLLNNTEVSYIGMIGSINKVRTVFSNLNKKGITIDSRVYSPIGLKIGVSLPEQIALSIITEIVCISNTVTCKHASIIMNKS